MNWKPLPETRYKYLPVRSTAASMRQTVSGNGFQPMSLSVNRAAMHDWEMGFTDSLFQTLC
jgi:hypothetical protein